MQRRPHACAGCQQIARSEAARLARVCVDKLRSISEWSSGYDTTGQV